MPTGHGFARIPNPSALGVVRWSLGHRAGHEASHSLVHVPRSGAGHMSSQ